MNAAITLGGQTTFNNFGSYYSGGIVTIFGAINAASNAVIVNSSSTNFTVLSGALSFTGSANSISIAANSNGIVYFNSAITQATARTLAISNNTLALTFIGVPTATLTLQAADSLTNSGWGELLVYSAVATGGNTLTVAGGGFGGTYVYGLVSGVTGSAITNTSLGGATFGA